MPRRSRETSWSRCSPTTAPPWRRGDPGRHNSDGYDTAGIHPDNRGTRRLKLRTNGGTNEATHEFAPDSNGLPLVHAVSTILPMRAGQFVEAVVKQTSGDDLDIALGVDSEFQMCWLAPFPL
jgi:hypothetical protein